MENPGEVLLTLLDKSSTDDQLQALTRELNGDLVRETDLKTSFPHDDAPAAGYRGDAMEIGKLAVQFLSSGTVAALVNVLIAYFARKPKLTVELKRSNGDVLTVTGSDTDAKALDATISRLRGFLSE